MSYFFLQICNRVTTLVDVRILYQPWTAELAAQKIFNLLENYFKILACSRVSDRCPLSYLSKIFSPETTWPIKAKFYAEPSWEGGTKVCTNGPGHMTKIAAMPIYGKNLHKSSSPEPVGRFPRNLVCIIEDSCP